MSNPARNDSKLVLCLLLCVYEILSSSDSLKVHLKGASILIKLIGVREQSSRLTRFFHILDISNAMICSSAPIWGDCSDLDLAGPSPWPVYDTEHVAITSFQKLMTIMAKMACLSEASLSHQGESQSRDAHTLHADLLAWWQSCPPQIRSQTNDWRDLSRRQPLGVDETLQQELFTRIRACRFGCELYLQHILNPLCKEPWKGASAVEEIMKIVDATPPGHGLELGLDWSMFVAGLSISCDYETEGFIRKYFCQEGRQSPYPASPLTLLETLWEKQHRDGHKHDWRQVKAEARINWWVLRLMARAC
ncbi:fungal-specific transcription factor domain-containing protein [Cadophora sp. MPI-SDFR-AT-0126]|nr:fungal-specific transcription factor domain-containing protein [Leotiomycetes sp. MPI-SDFR-AT-0126]